MELIKMSTCICKSSQRYTPSLESYIFVSYLIQLITATKTEYGNSLDVQSDILVVVSQSIKDFFKPSQL